MKNWIKTRIIKLITLIGLSSFQVKDKHSIGGVRSYRVTGYYYCYTFADGNRKFVRCPKFFANMIGGYGVAGCYIPFHEVDGLGFSFKRWHFFREALRTNRKRIENDSDSFKFLRSVPKGLTAKEYEDYALESILSNLKLGKSKKN